MVQAAIKLIAERGYDGFTLADVGEAAGYSRGLPTHYFGRKSELLALAAQYAVDAYYAAVARLPEAQPGLPRLVAVIRQYFARPAAAGGGRRFLAIVIAEAMVRPGLRKTIGELNARGIAGLTAELSAGVAAGNIRADVDIDLQARLIHAFLRGQAAFAAMDPKTDSQAVAEEFIATLEVALRPG